MLDILKTLVIKAIPSNWYTTKKTCDIITKVCDTIIELKWFVFPTIIVLIVGVTIAFVFFCRWKITKLKYKMVRNE
jgi:hypothetical protein